MEPFLSLVFPVFLVFGQVRKKNYFLSKLIKRNFEKWNLFYPWCFRCFWCLGRFERRISFSQNYLREILKSGTFSIPGVSGVSGVWAGLKEELVSLKTS